MILIRKEVVDNYLGAIGQNRAWLARELKYTEGYLSQILNNGCKISAPVVERLSMRMGADVKTLFVFTGEEDTREFYGETFFIEGRVMNKTEYYAWVKERQTFSEADLYRDKKNYSPIYFSKSVDKTKSVVL